MEQLRDNLKEWVGAVLKETGWTQREWCLRAGTTPTNLSKFLNSDDNGFIPSGNTIHKLSSVVPIMPFSFEAMRRTKFIPILNPTNAKRFMSMGASTKLELLNEELEYGKKIAVSVDSKGVFAVVVTEKTMLGAGIVPGSTLILDGNISMTNGSICVCQNEGKIEPYRFYDGMLMPENSTENFPPMRAKDATILGRAISLYTDL